MPLTNFSVVGTAVTTIASAASGNKNILTGYSITASGAGTIAIKAGTATIVTIVSPNAIEVEPGAFRWDNLIGLNDNLTITADGAGVTYAGVASYQKMDHQFLTGTPLGLLLLLTRN